MNISISRSSSYDQTPSFPNVKEEVEFFKLEKIKAIGVVNILKEKYESEISDSNYIQLLEAEIKKHEILYKLKDIETNCLHTLLESRTSNKPTEATKDDREEEIENQRPAKKLKSLHSVVEPQYSDPLKKMERRIIDQEETINRLEATNASLTAQLKREIAYKQEFTASKTK